MLKKRIIAASVAAMLTTPAFAGSPSDWTLDGQALFEYWQDSNQETAGSQYTDYEVFTLHEIGFGSSKSIGGGNRFVWHLFTRIQNGDRRFGSGDYSQQTWGNREAWAGFEGESWGQIGFGRFLTKAFTVVNWPYSCDAGTCEANAETGAHALTVGNAVRYATPAIGPFNGEVLYGFGGSSAAGRPSYVELYGHVDTKPVKVDLIYTTLTNGGLLGPNSTFDLGGFSDGTKQSELFVGARVPFGGGIEGVFAYAKSTYHVDGGVGGAMWWTPNGTGADEVSQAHWFVQGKFAMGKELIGVDYTHWDDSDAGSGADYDDAATVIGAKWTHTFVPGVFGYVFIRDYKLDGSHRPSSTAPWQFGNMDMPAWGMTNVDNDVIRIGFGAQLLY